jgi:hypothetical protein
MDSGMVQIDVKEEMRTIPKHAFALLDGLKRLLLSSCL